MADRRLFTVPNSDPREEARGKSASPATQIAEESR